MGEIILGIVNVIFIVYHWLYVREVSHREHRYIEALLARNLPELVEAGMAKQTPKAEPPQEPEFVPAEVASDELFSKAIKEQLKGV